MSEGYSPPRKRPWTAWLLVLLPFWLFVSAGIGIWLWVEKEQSPEIIEPSKFAKLISGVHLEDDFYKLAQIVGPRNVTTKEGRRGLNRAAAMIEGALGASNAGYRVVKTPGPKTAESSWPIISAISPGTGEIVWMVVGYDTALGEAGVVANSASIAAILAVAQELAGEELNKPLGFMFLPHVMGGPVAATVAETAEVIAAADAVIVVGSMAEGGHLEVSASAPEQIDRIQIGSRKVADGPEVSAPGESEAIFGSLLSAISPIVRIATRSNGEGSDIENEDWSPSRHLQATKALAKFVRGVAQ